jgi:DNA-binding transcriptional LysR family regulator
MDLERLRCFVAVAEELHFGRAAQSLGLLPASLGRHIRLLEEEVGVPLFHRTTRSVALTAEALELLDEVRAFLAQADAIAARLRSHGRQTSAKLRIGAIDSAAAGLLPRLLQDIRHAMPGLTIQITEDRSIRLLPRLLSGRLDLAFVRPPDQRSPAIRFDHLVYETAVVTMPSGHPLVGQPVIAIADLAGAPLIVPDRRSRPHSHDLTMRLFAEARVTPRIGQMANEKQTIINLVASGLGVAIVPRWTSQLGAAGVVFTPIELPQGAVLKRLPLAMATLRDVRDPVRDAVLTLLRDRAEAYFASA